MKFLATPFALVCFLNVACNGDDEASGPSKEEARKIVEGGRADGVDYCEAQGWYGDGVCDDFCAKPDLDCAVASPIDPAFCADGELVFGPDSFIASTDGMECTIPQVHCVTRDFSACPQIHPLPPDFCSEGRVAMGEDVFVSSTDGKECRLPSVHCLTNDFSACPQIHPIPPDFCPDGEAQSGPSSFVPSPDGLECEIPSVHCVSTDAKACPQF